MDPTELDALERLSWCLPACITGGLLAGSLVSFVVVRHRRGPGYWGQPEGEANPGAGASDAPGDGQHTMPDGTKMEGDHHGEHTMPEGTKMKGDEHRSGESGE
jgi:hypothetical protein